MKINLIAATGLATILTVAAQAQTTNVPTGTHPTTAPVTAPAAAPAAPASAPAAPPPAAMAQAAPGTDAKAGAKLSAGDKKFVEKASAANLSEIAEAQIALQKSSRDDVKQFAQKMVDDHTKAGDKLKDIVSGSDAQVATSPDSADQKAADKLGTLDGAKFDAKYISDQKTAHRKAVALFKKESEKGKDPALKQFAADTLPTLQGHYDMVKGLPKK